MSTKGGLGLKATDSHELRRKQPGFTNPISDLRSTTVGDQTRGSSMASQAPHSSPTLCGKEHHRSSTSGHGGDGKPIHSNLWTAHWNSVRFAFEKIVIV